RDNSSTSTLANGGCGVGLTAGKVTTYPLNPYDYWPNTLYDPREGALRDTAPSNTAGVSGKVYNQMIALSGVMQYIELDANNIARYFSGAIGSSGTLAFDPNNAPNDFTVYVS